MQQELQPLVIFGYGVPESTRSSSRLEFVDLNSFELANPPKQEEAPDEATRKQLKNAITQIFARATSSRANLLLFVSDRELSPATVYVMLMVRRLLPSLRMALADSSDSIGASLKALNPRGADVLVREASLEKVMNMLPQVLADPSSVEGTKVYWRTEDGIVEWNKKTDDDAEVLLIVMPAWSNDFAPFGLAHISSALKSVGFGVKILDLNCLFWTKLNTKFDDCAQFENIVVWSSEDRYQTEIKPLLDPVFAEIKKAIASGKYKYYGFSTFNTNRIPTENACALIRELQPDAKIFAGGPSCISSWAQTMLTSPQGFDAAVFGEGELTAIDLLSAWRDGDSRSVPGAWLKLPDGSINKGLGRPLADMKTLPLPDFDDFPLYNYKSFTLPIFFSRGCVAKCTFCVETLYWKKFRMLPTERVLDTIGRAISEYGITSFQVNDSLMNGSHKVLEEIADGIIARGYKVQFGGYCRFENRLSRELLFKLARAGCESIYFGMESGSQKVIDLMQKQVQVKNYERILRDATDAGIRCLACVIVGFPGENWFDFWKTLKMLWRVSPFLDDVNLSILEISVGTPLANDMTKFGIEFTHEGPIRAWRTTDKRNTFAVRYFRYRLLSGMWKLMKKRKVSPEGWDFEYQDPLTATS